MFGCLALWEFERATFRKRRSGENFETRSPPDRQSHVISCYLKLALIALLTATLGREIGAAYLVGSIDFGSIQSFGSPFQIDRLKNEPRIPPIASQSFYLPFVLRKEIWFRFEI